ncbi:hypothetical protein J2805_002968 [Arthrobacter oryzae]|nr:hypothetical protein [Arthrobacter oryzae]
MPTVAHRYLKQVFQFHRLVVALGELMAASRAPWLSEWMQASQAAKAAVAAS